jgi:hypothetical protein
MKHIQKDPTSKTWYKSFFNKTHVSNFSHYLNYDKLFIQKISFVLIKFNGDSFFNFHYDQMKRLDNKYDGYENNGEFWKRYY